MKNFQLIASGLDTMPLLHALQLRADLWNENTLRTSHDATPHKEVDDVWLRFQDLAPYENGNAAAVVDEHESISYPAWFELSMAQDVVLDLMRRVRGVRLGRVLITRLRPGGKIDPHEDGGEHAAYYERYHVVLQGLPGSVFRCGTETVQMRTGEVWWFNNGIEHEVINNSADDRIHMIVDIRQ